MLYNNIYIVTAGRKKHWWAETEQIQFLLRQFENRAKFSFHSNEHMIESNDEILSIFKYCKGHLGTEVDKQKKKNIVTN